MLFLLFLLLLSGAIHAQELTFLPRNEEVESVSTNESAFLGEIDCPAVKNTLNSAKDCVDCIDLKRTCPDCCLVEFPPGRGRYEALRCTGINDLYGSDPALGCDPVFRFGPACTQARFTTTEANNFYSTTTIGIPNAQQRGCPGVIPTPGTPPIMPSFEGCDAVYFGNFTNDYFIETSTPYLPTADYTSFVNGCKNDADARELCVKRELLCGETVCPLKAGGYAANCTHGDCLKRLDIWERANKTVLIPPRRECRDLQAADCITLVQLAQRCLNRLNSGCSSCFKPVYAKDVFQYKFIAKSKEKLVLLWKLYAASTGDSSPNSYFYSKIQVEAENGDVIYASPLHQKSYTGSFSIFSTVVVPPRMLSRGHEYFVRPYYYINEDDVLNLQITVSGAEITAIKVRE